MEVCCFVTLVCFNLGLIGVGVYGLFSCVVGWREFTTGMFAASGSFLLGRQMAMVPGAMLVGGLLALIVCGVSLLRRAWRLYW
jgi:hypothetical protein